MNNYRSLVLAIVALSSAHITTAGAQSSLDADGPHRCLQRQPGGKAERGRHRRRHVHDLKDAARQIAAGEKSTPYRPLSDTINTMEIIDEIRRQINIVFPGE